MSEKKVRDRQSGSFTDTEMEDRFKLLGAAVGRAQATVFMPEELVFHPTFLANMSFEFLMEVFRKNAGVDPKLADILANRLLEVAEQENLLQYWLDLYWLIGSSRFNSDYYKIVDVCFSKIDKAIKSGEGGFDYWYREVYSNKSIAVGGNLYDLVLKALLKRAKTVDHWKIIKKIFPDPTVKKEALQKIREITALEQLNSLSDQIGFGDACVVLHNELPDDFWSSLNYEQCQKVYMSALSESKIEEKMFLQMVEIALNNPDLEDAFYMWLDIYKYCTNIAHRSYGISSEYALEQMGICGEQMSTEWWYIEAYERSVCGTAFQKLVIDAIYERADRRIEQIEGAEDEEVALDEASRSYYEIYIAYKVALRNSREKKYYLDVLRLLSPMVDLEKIFDD
ncbi:MAG: hypothetical protein GF349_04315 [Candidatus Magasanikbacteria bacterium]|nr:hypothetical protein [Candidatus Magasanikbacteria bacterium]